MELVTGERGQDRGEEARSVIGRINELTSPTEQCTEVRSSATVEKAEICSEAARHAALCHVLGLVHGGGTDQECQVGSKRRVAAWLLIDLI